MQPAKPWAPTARGLAVTVRLTPKGGRDALEGLATLADGAPVLKARVRAAPHEGAANAALVALVAKAAGVPPRRVTLTSGATARVKTLTIEGTAADLVARLEQILGETVP